MLTGGAPGGLLLSINEIEGVPGFPDGVPGYELCPMVQEQAGESGAEFEMTELAGLEPDGDGWRLATDGAEYTARTLILATGAHLKELGVEGEQRLQGRGVSHCASCDGPLLRDKVVGVVGGGDSALQEALTLAQDVAEVIVLVRGDELAAQATYRERALAHPKIVVRHGAVVEEVLGEDQVAGRAPRATAPSSSSRACSSTSACSPTRRSWRDQLTLDADGHVPVDGRAADRAARPVRGRRPAPRRRGPGGRLGRRRRARRQGRPPLPRRRRWAERDPCRGDRGRLGKRRHTCLRS